MAGTRNTPAGNGRYQGWYKSHDGRRVWFAGTTSKAETRRIAADLEDEARKIALGYVEAPTTAAKHRGRAFAETAAEYLAWGAAQGGRGGRPWGPEHLRKRTADLSWWKRRLGLETLADLDMGLLARAEAALRELGAEVRPAGRKGAGTVRTGKTLANTAESLAAFCRWAVGRGYLDKNPLDGLAGFDTTPQTRRRAFSPEELGRLIGAAPSHRQLLYKVAATSGLRANELRSLAPRHLDRDRRGLLLEASWTKGRRDDFQPMPGAVFADLLAAAEGKGDDEPLLRVSPNMMNVMDRDLARAGVAKHGRGGKVDFHSLRVTYTSLVIEAGASGKEAMSLARHTTPNLTFNVYGRARDERLADLAEAVGAAALAKVGAGESEAVCAAGVHKLAAGAEGTSHIPFADSGLGHASEAKMHGFKSPSSHQMTEAQDPDKSCASSFQPLADSDTCDKAKGAAGDKSATSPQQPQDAILRQKCAAGVLKPDTANGYGVCSCGGACSKSDDPALAALLAGIRKAWPGMSARERALLSAAVGIEGGKP